MKCLNCKADNTDQIDFSSPSPIWILHIPLPYSTEKPESSYPQFLKTFPVSVGRTSFLLFRIYLNTFTIQITPCCYLSHFPSLFWSSKIMLITPVQWCLCLLWCSSFSMYIFILFFFKLWLRGFENETEKKVI